MSGGTLSHALERRVRTVCETELPRLARKLHPLSAEDRLTAEAIIADVIAALIVRPARALPADCPPATVEALVRLFDLDVAAS